MKSMKAKDGLDRFRAPGEREAEDRAWAAVRAAYQRREPAARDKSLRRPFVVAVTAALIIGVGALTPAGATVGHLVGHAFERPHAPRSLTVAREPSPQALVTDEAQNRLLCGRPAIRTSRQVRAGASRPRGHRGVRERWRRDSRQLAGREGHDPQSEDAADDQDLLRLPAAPHSGGLSRRVLRLHQRRRAAARSPSSASAT